MQVEIIYNAHDPSDFSSPIDEFPLPGSEFTGLSIHGFDPDFLFRSPSTKKSAILIIDTGLASTRFR